MFQRLFQRAKRDDTDHVEGHVWTDDRHLMSSILRPQAT